MRKTFTHILTEDQIQAIGLAMNASVERTVRLALSDPSTTATILSHYGEPRLILPTGSVSTSTTTSTVIYGTSFSIPVSLTPLSSGVTGLSMFTFMSTIPVDTFGVTFARVSSTSGVYTVGYTTFPGGGCFEVVQPAAVLSSSLDQNGMGVVELTGALAWGNPLIYFDAVRRTSMLVAVVVGTECRCGRTVSTAMGVGMALDDEGWYRILRADFTL